MLKLETQKTEKLKNIFAFCSVCLFYDPLPSICSNLCASFFCFCCPAGFRNTNLPLSLRESFWKVHKKHFTITVALRCFWETSPCFQQCPHSLNKSRAQSLSHQWMDGSQVMERWRNGCTVDGRQVSTLLFFTAHSRGNSHYQVLQFDSDNDIEPWIISAKLCLDFN